jgi:hypothetical protein
MKLPDYTALFSLQDFYIANKRNLSMHTHKNYWSLALDHSLLPCPHTLIHLSPSSSSDTFPGYLDPQLLQLEFHAITKTIMESQQQKAGHFQFDSQSPSLLSNGSTDFFLAVATFQFPNPIHSMNVQTSMAQVAFEPMTTQPLWSASIQWVPGSKTSQSMKVTTHHLVPTSTTMTPLPHVFMVECLIKQGTWPLVK